MDSVAHRGSVEAVVDGDVRLTYSELGDRVIEATRAMIAAGISRGDRVAVWAPNGLGWIVAALGAHCAGAALVPINTRWKGAEAAYVLSAAKVSLLFTTVGFLDTDTVAMLDDDPTDLPDLRSIVLLDGSAEPLAQVLHRRACGGRSSWRMASRSRRRPRGSGCVRSNRPMPATRCSRPARPAVRRVW